MNNPRPRDTRPAAVPGGHAGPLSRLTIDLDAVARNYLFLRKKLGPGTDCAAVVKANAYGLGATHIGLVLFRQGCRHFFTATFEEALALKQALPAEGAPGQDVAIYMLSGPWGASPEDILAAGAVPVLNSLADVEYWAGAAAQAGQRYPALVHIDTGMNRLGLPLADIPAMARFLPALDIRYALSHLACSEQAENEMNGRQLALFRQALAVLGVPLRASLANSGGVFLGPAYHFDMVRPGCALYGINPVAGSENPMQGVVGVQARILQVRAVDAPATVGYGAHYRIETPTVCATLAAGYADGYLRSLVDRGMVYVGGVACPVIGRVSMDLIVADIGAVPQTPRPGDWADIIGPQQPVDTVAAQAGTIGYEILTALGARYARTYLGGAEDGM